MLGTPQDLSESRAKLFAQRKTGMNDAAEMIKFLRLVRELAVNDAECVCEYGSYILAKAKGRLGAEEYWQLREDVAVAAMTCGHLEVAEACVIALEGKFRDSVRVGCLRGMLYEAHDLPEDAIELYEEILKEHPASATAHRRQIATHIGSGDKKAAIAAAIKYLDVFQTDSTVWNQLYQLYLEQGQLSQAQFCLEETLLASPNSTVTLLKLADLLFAQGGEQVSAARGYYARVVEATKGESARALYGVLACQAMGAGPLESGGAASPEQAPLHEAARGRLLRMYETAAPALLPCVEKAVSAMEA